MGGNDDNGKGGRVEVGLKAGEIVTTGEAAHGIFAQSIGGAQAAGSSGLGGAVLVDVDGRIRATGKDANGVMAQSEGLGGNGDVTVNVSAASDIKGGTGLGRAILVRDGKTNRIENRGLLRSAAGADGTVIESGTGNDRVVNFGAVRGSVDLGAGRNAFVNRRSGVFVPGSEINLADRGRLTNHGTLVVGRGDASPVRITGDLVQGERGVTRFVLSSRTPEVDPMVRVGGTATLDGTIDPVIRDPALLQAGRGRIVLMNAAEGLNDGAPELLTIKDDPVASYVLVTRGDQLILRYTADLDGPKQAAALNDNQEQIAAGLDALREEGTLTSATASLLAETDLEAFGSTLDRFGPEPYAANQIGTLFSSLQFSDSLLDCAADSADFLVGDARNCGWMRVQTRHLERDSTGDSARYKDDSYEIAAGAERALGDGWSIGGGLAYEAPSMKTGSFADTDGHQFQAGLTGRKALGAWTLAATVNAGRAWLDVDREVADGQHAKGDQDLTFATGRLGADHAFALAGWRVVTAANFATTVIHEDGVDENGASAADLDVQSRSETFLSLHPSVEVSRSFVVHEGWSLTPRASIGLTRFLTDNSPTARARFADTAGGETFSATSDMDQTYLDLAVGVEVASRGVAVRATGFGQLGENTEGYGGSLGLALSF